MSENGILLGENKLSAITEFHRFVENNYSIYDHNKKHEVHADASSESLAGVLLQSNIEG